MKARGNTRTIVNKKWHWLSLSKVRQTEPGHFLDECDLDDPIVVASDKSGKYLILDGNHRYMTAKILLKSKIKAWILTEEDFGKIGFQPHSRGYAGWLLCMASPSVDKYIREGLFIDLINRADWAASYMESEKLQTRSNFILKKGST